MRCSQCDIEMMVDNVVKTDNSETFNYKCRNPKCSNYGYGGVEDEGESNKDE